MFIHLASSTEDKENDAKVPDEKSFPGLQKHPGVSRLETHPVLWSSSFHRPLEDHGDLEKNESNESFQFSEEDPGAQRH